MRTLLFFAFVCTIGAAFGNIKPEPTIRPQKAHLLGAKECTWGPSYWCKNLTTAAGCHATKHCIQTVWVHQTLPPDYSSVCQTCLEMVKEARDQLLSNETQEEIKEVFEGSCKLLPVRIVSNECCKLADEFIPELIDALASQMNPQVVCSVAGLCNNERVHRLLQEHSSEIISLPKSKKSSDRCEGCHTVLDMVEKKFRRANRDQVLQNFMQICGRMGSLSDACSNIVVTYFNEIYQHLEDNLNPNDFCLMAGECSAMFHTHANVEITPLSNVGVVPVVQHDDLPCDLCTQLVKHLQDILIANTTEDEFHKVLTGICKQTKSFKDECTSIVDEYYPIIYNFLVNELNGTVVCSLIGICPGPGLLEFDDATPIMPLLPVETAQNPLLSARPVVPIGRVRVNKGGSSVQVLQTPELAQLPIERLVPNTLTIIGNTELCEFCEYFLHFVQQAITDPATEEEIKHVVEEACGKLPRSVNETCQQFVDTYGPAFVALLAQEIDPSVVCPKLSLCPSVDMHKVHNVEVFMHRNKGEKPNCPLCLFAITSLEELIKNKRTEENIRRELNTLCSHLSGNLAEECNDFVETYANEIVEACIAQLNPQEVCVYLKLCEDKTPPHVPIPKIEYGGEIETNLIPDRTANGHVITQLDSNSQVCVLCEFIMSQIDQELKDNATETEIKKMVHSVCNHLPKSVRSECNGFVDQYADAVIAMLVQNLDPSQICAELKLCDPKRTIPVVNDLMNIETFQTLNEDVNSPQCSLCKIIMTQIENMLQGKVSEDQIIKAVHGVCNLLPRTQRKECNDFISKNGEKIIDLLKIAVQPSEICSFMFFCSSEFNSVKLEIRKCSVCEAAVDIMDRILENPNVDHEIEHVLEKTCRALPYRHQQMCQNLIDTYGRRLFELLSHAANPGTVCNEIGVCGSRVTRPPRDTPLVGADKCTWGPGYWCLSRENANECGAVQHCEEKVWNQNQNQQS